MKMTRIQIRQFSRLHYHQPETVLRNFRNLEIKMKLADGGGLSDKEMRLRTNKLKKAREARSAAVFAYAMQECVLQTPVLFAPHEDADYDFVMSWNTEEETLFCPVQLKELTPEDINPEPSMADILGKLNRYSDTKNLVVAIDYNRTERFEFGPWLRVGSAPVAEIWFFGERSPNGMDWFHYGDLTNEPAFHPFRYPT